MPATGIPDLVLARCERESSFPIVTSGKSTVGPQKVLADLDRIFAAGANVSHRVNRLGGRGRADLAAIFFERIRTFPRLNIFALIDSPRDIARGTAMEQNPSFPSPEELKAKLSEFMKSNFGDKVSFATFTQPETGGSRERGKAASKVSEDEFVFDFLPRDIKAHLDRFVIQQDEAKKVLSIAVCDHYNHVNYLRRLEKEDAARAEETEYAKQNVILVGPTGVGKTYLIKHIAELIKVPFVKADATKFSETGYVGGDVEDLVRELVHKADGDVQPRAVRHHLHRRDRQDRGGGKSDRDAT